MLANEFIRLPFQFVGAVPPGTPSWGQAHKEFMRQNYRRNIMVQGPTQDMPTWDGRVQLDPVVKDYWGLPVLRISGDKHDHTIEIANRQAERAEAWLKEAGAVLDLPAQGGPGRVRPASTSRARAAWATTPRPRWSTRPAASTTCPTCSSIDASVHVTNGGFNPVLTIFANAFRASELMVKAWKGGGLRG